MITTQAADPALIEDLVAANRILADQGVLDGFGHVSARHDKDPSYFLLARSMAPALVTAAASVLPPDCFCRAISSPAAGHVNYSGNYEARPSLGGRPLDNIIDGTAC